MYNPTAFLRTDQQSLFDFIEQHSFGLLVSNHDSDPFGSHLPFLLDRTAGKQGRLIGHMARANPQWQQADGRAVFAVFSGPHAYISPTWYQEREVVPTWNYVVVHARGQLRAIHDCDRILQIVSETVRHFEASQHAPWVFDATTDSATRLAGQIVGFEIDLTHLQGKWKLSQNHSVQRQRTVVEELLRTGDAGSREIAELMQDNLTDGVMPE